MKIQEARWHVNNAVWESQMYPDISRKSLEFRMKMIPFMINNPAYRAWIKLVSATSGKREDSRTENGKGNGS